MTDQPKLHESRPLVSRRQLLATGAAGAAAVMAAPLLGAAPTPPVVPAAGPVRRPLRIVHLTDLHQMERRNAVRGIETVLGHALARSPDLILQGGDIMTGTMSNRLEDTRRHMREVERLVAQARQHVPVISAIGNHDIWGWTRARSGATGSEPEFGKTWYLEALGDGKLYHSTPMAELQSAVATPWQIIVLDSIQPLEEGYVGGLDDAQYEWLRQELLGLDRSRPVLVFSHIPILGMSVQLFDGRPGAPGDRTQAVIVPRASVFNDPWRVAELFRQHGNVRLALSGHVHVFERCDYAGTAFICGGAASGAWWNSSAQHAANRNRNETPFTWRPPRAEPGFGLAELHPDGNFTYEYVRWDWTFAD